MSTTTELREPPRVSGGTGENAHLDELRTDPIALMARVRAECGDVGEFTIGGRDVVLLTGADANEFYFRAPEEQLDQAEAYPFMTPIFGKGVVFDAPPERRREMLHNQALRDKFMRGHAATIAAEVEQMVAAWGDEGEIDLLEWFAELTIYTSSACLIGARFRRELDGRFAQLYHDLERGTDPIAYVDPYADIESFRRRDEARVALVELVSGIMDRRAAGPPPAEGESDLLDVLMSIREEDGSLRFSADTVTGMFISMMFAGHHTTSGTAAWTLIELLRHPAEMAAVTAELDELYGDGSEVSFQALREIPRLESSIKEALRLHPPLILLLRMAMEDLDLRRVPDRRRQVRGRQPRRLQPHPRGLPRCRRFRAGPLPRAPRGGPDQPVDVDPVRGGAASLRRRQLRHDAAEGHLLRAAARGGSSRRRSRSRAIATTTPKWSSSWSSRAGCGTGAVRVRRHEDRGGPRPVPGARRVRG